LNNFTGNCFYNLMASGDCDMIYAENNWWGTSVESEIRAKLYHGKGLSYIDYDPWRSGSAKPVAVLEDPRERAAGEENALGGRLLAEGKVAEAIDGFKRVIAEYDDTEAALFSLDHLIQAYGQMDQGTDLSYLESVAQEHPGTELGALASEFVVRHLVSTGEYAQAIKRARQILTAYPGRTRNEYLSFQIGLIYLLMGDRERADEAFRAFLTRYPVDLQQRPDDLLPSLARIRLGLDPWGIEEKKEIIEIPETISLSQNHPNPFNAETVISFGLPRPVFVKLEVYSTLGQRIRTLVETQMKAGRYSVTWDGKDGSGREVSSGIYFCCLKTREKTLRVRKMLFLK